MKTEKELPKTWQSFPRGAKPPDPTARCPRLFDILHRKHWERMKCRDFPYHPTRQLKREMARLAARREVRDITSKAIKLSSALPAQEVTS